MAQNNDKLHIVMLPWLAFGHLIPYLELAKLIAQKGHKISFISTQRNIDRLPKIPQNIVPLVNFVKFTLPHEEQNLPENAEATVDIPLDKVPYLKKAFDRFQEPLAQFLEASTPDWIIYDFAPCWVPPIASKLGISRALFSIFNAWANCLFAPSTSVLINGGDPRKKPEHFTVPAGWVPFPNNVSFRIHEVKKVLEVNVEGNTVSGISDLCRFGLGLQGCDILVVRSGFELESEWLKLLEDLHHKHVIPSGLLPPSITNNEIGQDNTGSTCWIKISEWLNKQNVGSVVYVALGSEVTMSQGELTELAMGLELSGLPFFWVLRKLHDDDHLVLLPDGFEERIEGRGIVWKSWAPQVRILAHDSVGGFLTHCGWSSIIESLNFGRALIMLPFNVDQGLNARVFEEKMVGIEIPRDEESGSFTVDMVAKTVKLVIMEDEGRIYREKAKEMSKIFADKDLHHGYVDNLVGYLENHHKKNVSEYSAPNK